METPSSTRRVTRSQTLAAASARKVEESEKTVSKSMQKSSKNQQQDRSALIDITNDSPIVGLAMASLKTPSSAVSKKRMNNQGQFTRTPGSGEALLRGQVKTLLQKVEEEAEVSKITLENRPFFNLQGLINSPINLVAPTPANTPQIFNFSPNADGLPSVTPVTEKFLIPQMLNGMLGEKKQGNIESEIVITRSLLLDFSEKSDSSDCSSVLTYQGLVCGERDSSKEKGSTDDDDDASIWSIQVNASSTRDEDDEEEEVESCTEEEYYEEEEEEEYGFGDNGWLLDDVCEGMSKISVKELLDDVCEGMSKISVKELPKFEGKHIRFIYNSDGEIEEEEEECETPSDDMSKNQKLS